MTITQTRRAELRRIASDYLGILITLRIQMSNTLDADDRRTLASDLNNLTTVYLYAVYGMSRESVRTFHDYIMDWLTTDTYAHVPGMTNDDLYLIDTTTIADNFATFLTITHGEDPRLVSELPLYFTDYGTVAEGIRKHCKEVR